jgi:hypothetical protein
MPEKIWGSQKKVWLKNNFAEKYDEISRLGGNLYYYNLMILVKRENQRYRFLLFLLILF